MKRSVVSSPAALSPSARELLELGSFVVPPTAEQDERMDRALARLIALDRAGAPATKLGHSGSSRARGPLHRAPRAPVWRLSQALSGSSMSKLWLALGALAATAGASFWMGRASLPDGAPSASPTSALEAPVQAPVAVLPQRPAQAADAARTEAAPLPEAPAPSGPSLAAGARATSRDDTGPRAELAAGASRPAPLDEGANEVGVLRAKRTRSPEAPASPMGLSAEIQRLARAEAALRQGRVQQALVDLETPAAHLQEQAAALRAIAECTLGRTSAAPRARDTLLRWPTSAFAPRIREACGL